MPLSPIAPVLRPSASHECSASGIALPVEGLSAAETLQRRHVLHELGPSFTHYVRRCDDPPGAPTLNRICHYASSLHAISAPAATSLRGAERPTRVIHGNISRPHATPFAQFDVGPSAGRYPRGQCKILFVLRADLLHRSGERYQRGEGLRDGDAREFLTRSSFSRIETVHLGSLLRNGLEGEDQVVERRDGFASHKTPCRGRCSPCGWGAPLLVYVPVDPQLALQAPWPDAGPFGTPSSIHISRGTVLLSLRRERTAAALSFVSRARLLSAVSLTTCFWTQRMVAWRGRPRDFPSSCTAPPSFLSSSPIPSASIIRLLVQAEII